MSRVRNERPSEKVAPQVEVLQVGSFCVLWLGRCLGTGATYKGHLANRLITTDQCEIVSRFFVSVSCFGERIKFAVSAGANLCYFADAAVWIGKNKTTTKLKMRRQGATCCVRHLRIFASNPLERSASCEKQIQ